MTELFLMLAALVAVGGFLLMTRNANLLFEVRVRDGRVVRIQGHVPPSLLSDIERIVASRPVAQARLRVERSRDIPVWRITGDVDERERQRLRNVLGMWPLAKLLRVKASGASSARGKGKRRARRTNHLKRVK